MFYGGLRQNLHYLHMYSSVPRVNRGDTLESGWAPESWHTVCANYSKFDLYMIIIVYLNNFLFLLSSSVKVS